MGSRAGSEWFSTKTHFPRPVPAARGVQFGLVELVVGGCPEEEGGKGETTNLQERKSVWNWTDGISILTAPLKGAVSRATHSE